MIGIVLDSVLMLLLVAALGYGVRLERKLSALRAGQLAFAGAVNELNTAAGRAESALVALRTSGEDADLLHDRIVKARTLKTELETLMTRMERNAPVASVAAPNPRFETEESRPARPSARADGRSDETTEDRRAARASAMPAATPLRSTTAVRRQQEEPAPLVSEEDDRARRMQALADRIQGMAAPRAVAPGRENVSAILGALQADRSSNHGVQDRINRARRNLDDDLFAA